jgi:membrane fusion protein, multidrug efflux system
MLMTPLSELPVSTQARGFLLAGLLGLGLGLAPGCAPHREANASEGGGGPPRAPVTVALPLSAPVTDYSEHNGRTEAPASVDVRTRASGHLVQANFNEGDLVKKGALLFVVDPRPLSTAVDRAKAELASVRADRNLAEKNLARAKQLLAAKAIADREWDVQNAALLQLNAREQVAVAAVASAQLDLEYAYVRSPITGRVGRKLITEGNLVGPTSPTPLTTVVSVDPLYVYVDVDEALGLKLTAAGHIAAEVGFPGEDGFPHEARIDFVDNRVNAGSGTLKLRAVVPNHDGKLRPGLFARVRVLEGGAHPALLISDRAVATDQDRRFVWVVSPDGKVQYRNVKLGALSDGLRVVREGLAAGDRVLVRGLQRVHPGAQVDATIIPMRSVDNESAANEVRK